MKPEDFVHLHCHSTYSLLEALPSPEEIVLRAKELRQRAVALTDTGYTYGLVEFTHAAKKHGLKPILGMEVDTAPEGSPTPSPLTLLAENMEGYSHLLELATAAALHSSEHKPRVPLDLLTTYGNGLIALTGPVSSALPQAAITEDTKRFQTLLEQYWSAFGKENVYLELIDLPTIGGQAEANQQLIAWGKKLHLPLVVTCNAHYCHSEDAEAHDALLCIERNAFLADPHRFSLREADLSMRPFEMLERSFSHIPQALENTRVIADRCTVEIPEGTYHIPTFPVPRGESEVDYLHKLCNDGLKKRYPKPSTLHRTRLEHELTIIEQMGFSGYFLIVADFVDAAKKRGITVGPGRGSAAGSIVSYCLGITSLDPLEHGLIFERFLNPERITMPDIDLDFADTRRDEVLTYVREHYGSDRVIQICTFGTLAARAAVKDVGRVYGVPFMEMNTLAKLIPERPGTLLLEALHTDELKSAYEGNETYRKIIDTALKLEGKARHVSIHACGVIITPEPAVRYTALQRAPKDDTTIITQYAAKSLESLGLLKMDFLGLTNLTVIQTTLEIIERMDHARLDISTIPLNDPLAFELLQRGETTGVFQLESAGMRRYLKQLKPTEFRDITAMVALYRPGPMEWIPSFIKRRHGEECVTYLHPDLQEIFKETYGIGVYQEQILELARAFAGFSLGEADLLRRAIGKKIKHELDAQEEKFISGAVKKGYQRELAERIFSDVILPFAGYGFPKAHAAGYARIAYETAYLKAHYPTEFMAALLSSDAQRTDRIMVEIDECRAMGIRVLPPDIHESLRHFTVISGEKGQRTIRFGLAAIKGIGESSVQQILSERERAGKFTSLENFARRVPKNILNKKFLESLAKSGALESFGEQRCLIEHYDRIVEYRKAWGDAQGGQSDLFSNLTEEGVEEGRIDFPATPAANPQQKLQWEKEVLGLYVSNHPLAGLKKYIGKKAQLISLLTGKDVGKKVTVAGVLDSLKKIRTKKGETMAILSLEDPTGKMELTLFPKIYSEVHELLERPDSVFVAGGTIDVRGGQLQLRADAIKRISLSTMIENARKEGFFDEEEERQGMIPVRRTLATDLLETTEAVDEEGNVIAGETVRMKDEQGEQEYFGPLGQWILDGMPIEHLFSLLGSQEASSQQLGAITPPLSSISIHTIDLPSEAPKQLLLDLKRIFERFPGKEKIQLRIGTQLLLLPLTISMSTILQKKVEEVLERHSIQHL